MAAATVDKNKQTFRSEKLIKDKRELIRSKTITATKDQRELMTASSSTIKKKEDVAAQAKAATMQKMTAQVQGSDAKKQLDALIAEFKGMRKDMKKLSPPFTRTMTAFTSIRRLSMKTADRRT